MNKANLKRILFADVIIALFFCSFSFITPITTGIANSHSNSSSDPKASAIQISSNPIGDEWPMFHDSLNHTGVTETIPVSGSGPIWNYTTGDCVDSSPAVANGMVYVGSYDNNTYCLNATTGVKIWNYTTGDYIESSPAVANGMVYIGSGDNNTYCLNATTGAKIWNYITGDPIGFSSPAIANGMVYIGSGDNNVYCLPMIMGSIPSVPLNLHFSAKNQQIILTWQSPSNNGGSSITEYKIYRGNSSGVEVLLATVGNVMEYTDSGLSSNTTYYYQVSAVNSIGEGPKCSEISATTLASNSTSSQKNNSIGGMGIGAILLVSIVGVMVAVIIVKKRVK